MPSSAALLTRGCLLVVLIAACSDAKDKPSPAADAGGPDRPAAEVPNDVPGSDTTVDPNLMCDPQNQLLFQVRGKTADGSVRWRLDRCMRDVCAGGCDVGNVYFAITYNGRTDAAKTPDIAYTRTHHNWNDRLIATLPDRVLRWRVVVDEGATVFKPQTFVSVETPAGVPILPDTETDSRPCLPPDGCGD